MKVLKDKLVDAGPEVVTKISEDRDKAESRLRAANRKVSELDGLVLEIQRQLEQVAEENIKVTDSCCSCSKVASNSAVFHYYQAFVSPTKKKIPVPAR